MVNPLEPESGPQRAPQAWRVVIATALAYALAAALTLPLMAGPPGYASPLFPGAGLALAAVLVYGSAALPGILVGALAVEASLTLLRGHAGLASLASLAIPAAMAAGATLQAGVGAWLVRRYAGASISLDEPREIVVAGLLGAFVACTVSASVGTLALFAAGAVGRDTWGPMWSTWWLGDTLGVLIAAPLALTLIGRPRSDWQPRVRTVGAPLLLALALMAIGLSEFRRIDEHRLVVTFERDADHLAAEAQTRLATAMHALEAIEGAVSTHPSPDADTLRRASQWWLAQPIQLQATGYSLRVPLAGLPEFESAARAEGYAGYRVFDRDGGAARAGDGEVVAVRMIEPAQGNQDALGVNALSIPAARAAILASRHTGKPAATMAFQLTQQAGKETGIVVYQALYRGQAEDEATRQSQFYGVVFVTLRPERALAQLAGAGQQYLRWCLVDPDPAAMQQRVAGPAGCQAQRTEARYQTQRRLDLGDRALLLRVSAPDGAVPGAQVEAGWLLFLSGLAAVSMLGALLLTVTGRSRRTELAVQQRTAELRREVAERRQAETALRESEARLRVILDHVPIGVVFLDADGGILECNPHLCLMTGRSAEQLRGTSVAALMQPHEAERLRKLHFELMHGAAHATLGSVALNPSGQGEQVTRLDIAALRSAKGRVVRMVGVLQDITEHQRLEASERALHRAEASDRAKGEFVSRMSHELRTPLNAMIGFTQLLGLEHDPALTAKQAEWTQQILRAGWHLLEMINETLDLARIESGAVRLDQVPVEVATLAAACRSMVATAAQQRGIRIDGVIDADVGSVLGDATRLKQVLTNLLSNAVKYNREGGAVTLGARRVAGQGVEVTVADTGLGMTPQQLAALFQPYNRLGRENSDVEGTGIGLVISRRLTELMGGTISVSSQEGVGSIFTLRLPAAVAAPAPAVRQAETLPAPYQRRLVHYVEDNATNIEVMRGIFAQRPQVELTTSMLALDGLAAIRRRRPDLVLLDMQLPDISGLELLRHLKQDDALAAIPVIVVSADASPESMRQALVSGALHYVTKPLDVAQFLRTVDAVLEAVDAQWGS